MGWEETLIQVSLEGDTGHTAASREGTRELGVGTEGSLLFLLIPYGSLHLRNSKEADVRIGLGALETLSTLLSQSCSLASQHPGGLVLRA